MPNGDYSSVIRKFRPESFKEGDIIDLNGKKLGKHEGIINYTIGQRRGIKISSSEPLYVIEIDSKKNTITVGTKDSLIIRKILLRDLNILGSEKDFMDLVHIKVRSTGRLMKAKVSIKENNALVEILENETGISPGQACVFYLKDNNGEKVLGGGWIHKTEKKNLST